MRPTSASTEFLVDLAEGSSQGLQEQLRAQLVDAVRDGRLVPGDRLPPSRQLARDLGVARGTVVDVYDQLVHEGFLVARRGSATMVSDLAAPSGVRAPAPSPADPTVHDLRPGAPDLGAFPRSAWASATTQVLRRMQDADLGYVHPWGSAVLREQLSPYLARTRHIVADPDDVIVVAGVTQGLTLLCRMLRARGHRSLAVEDPSNGIQRQVLSRYGLTMVDVPVDEHGIVVSALDATPARAVLVTPSHQYPTGVVMAEERRRELLSWAVARDALIIEDDYDAEFQFRRVPMPSLQPRSPEHVVHLSSVSKTLAPGLRLGWMVTPRGLRVELLGAKRDDDFGTAVISQHVLARLIMTGGYDRHLRRQRMTYRMRRDALVHAVGELVPSWRVRGNEAGLHLWLEPPEPVDEAAVVRAAGERGVLVLAMSGMCRTHVVPGLALGFARLPVHRAPAVVALLADAIAVASGPAAAPSAPGTVPLPGAALAGRLGTTGVDFFPAGLAVGREPSLVPDDGPP